ncbi:tetratricopeptide repeat protein [Paenibacillus donghaensis]|uniref:tetratricopeptide repeat protein n=1 Tax=Paenibacillus donghaensis TaxID=414771 RepID=UPI0018848EAE|nr:tetratricopeptide repeat protein [Paenibacillus donghaensis]MBE9912970.1 tetratricopeptide repeat protein [Paenibacillus donghaensis]
MKKEQFDFLLKSQPESPAQHYKLGVWYRSRGLAQEALHCFEKALSTEKNLSDFGKQAFDRYECLLEYGRLLRQLGRMELAITAFRECLARKRYATEALIEIGTMLHQSGTSDSEIRRQLTAIASELMEDDIFPIAETLWHLGAYSSALELYESHSLHTDLNDIKQYRYILCLIYINRFKKALSLLLRKAMHPNDVLLVTAQHTVRAAEAINVCKWCLHGMNGGIGLSNLSRYEALETAKTAIALGKINEAWEMLPSPTAHEYNELIYTLYKQGYRELAASLIAQMEQLPLCDRSQISLDICFIAAEIEYDAGNYEKAAAIFEAIYGTDPNHSTARFGAASCYLQQTRESLMARLESTIVGSEMFIKIERYLDNISRALQIMNITNWHTKWTPAQKRNHAANPGVLLH